MPQQPALTPTRIAEVLERTPTSSFVGGRFLGGTAALEVIDPATGRPVDSADARPGPAPATPAQGTEERRSSPEAGSARG